MAANRVALYISVKRFLEYFRLFLQKRNELMGFPGRI